MDCVGERPSSKGSASVPRDGIHSGRIYSSKTRGLHSSFQPSPSRVRARCAVTATPRSAFIDVGAAPGRLSLMGSGAAQDVRRHEATRTLQRLHSAAVVDLARRGIYPIEVTDAQAEGR